jgi:copper chaperone CopZ
VATLLLRIDGLEREDSERIEQLLRPIRGVFGVVVSPAEDRACLDIEDDEADLDSILARLEEAGYEAHLVG